MDIRNERRALERGAHIVVGTPGRLRDHITKGALDLSLLRAVVLDEADEMLDLGFREDLEFILAATPDERRTLLFSATVPRAIADLARTFQRDAKRVTATAASERHADIDYQTFLVQGSERDNAIINTLIYHEDTNAIVFCHTREAVKHLTARLSNRGFAVVALSGELTQSERTNALQAMRDGRARVCVATDVAARGIDLPNLDLVIHADLPSNPDTLLHRSGRTGRAGRKGVCVLVVPAHRRGAAARVLKLANIATTYRGAPTIAEIETAFRQRLLDSTQWVKQPDEDEMPLVAELLERLTPEKLAAAWLRQQIDARPVPEEISDRPIAPPAARGDRRSNDAPRAQKGEGRDTARPPRMEGGVWFSLSVGRRHRADPKWLLPLICKAGGVTKRDVGSIRIEDAETHFEIAGDRADDFAGQVAKGISGEKNLRIVPLGAGFGDTQEDRRAPRKDAKPWARPGNQGSAKSRDDKPRPDRPDARKPKPKGHRAGDKVGKAGKAPGKNSGKPAKQPR
jgi:ATP-dependent RNA helicase DeaD